MRETGQLEFLALPFHLVEHCRTLTDQVNTLLPDGWITPDAVVQADEPEEEVTLADNG